VKTSSSPQKQKYCGFVFDTKGNPYLRIPPPRSQDDVLPAQNFLSESPQISSDLSRLGLAVVTGVLASVVEATNKHSGQGCTHKAFVRRSASPEEVGHSERSSLPHRSFVWMSSGFALVINLLKTDPSATTRRATSQHLAVKCRQRHWNRRY
jgi:hypothetical protein